MINFALGPAQLLQTLYVTPKFIKNLGVKRAGDGCIQYHLMLRDAVRGKVNSCSYHDLLMLPPVDQMLASFKPYDPKTFYL